MPKNYKELIYKTLKDLHFESDPYLQNPNYRGSMEITPNFTVKEVSEYLKISTATARKWLNILTIEKKVLKGSKRRYFCNDPVTYVYARSDLPILRLKAPMRINWDKKQFAVFTKLSKDKSYFFKIKTRWVNLNHIDSLAEEIAIREKNTGEKYKVFFFPDFTKETIFN